MALAEVIVGRRNGAEGSGESTRELALIPFYLAAVERTNAAGRAVLVFEALDNNLASWIDRIVIQRAGLTGGAGSAFVYVGAENTVNLRDFTTSLPNVADGASPVWWAPGKALRVVLSGTGATVDWVVTVQGRQEVE